MILSIQFIITKRAALIPIKQIYESRSLESFSEKVQCYQVKNIWFWKRLKRGNAENSWNLDETFLFENFWHFEQAVFCCVSALEQCQKLGFKHHKVIDPIIPTKEEKIWNNNWN